MAHSWVWICVSVTAVILPWMSQTPGTVQDVHVEPFFLGSQKVQDDRIPRVPKKIF